MRQCEPNPGFVPKLREGVMQHSTRVFLHLREAKEMLHLSLSTLQQFFHAQLQLTCRDALAAWLQSR